MSSNLATTDIGALLAPEKGFDAEEGGAGFPWLKFFSQAAKSNVTECKEAGVKVNTFYLQDQLGIRALDACRLNFLKLFRYNAKFTPKGEIISIKGSDYRCPEKPQIYKQGLLALVHVYVPGGSGFACVTASTGLCRIAQGVEALHAEVTNHDKLAARGKVWEAATLAKHPSGSVIFEIGADPQEFDNGVGFIGWRTPQAPTLEEVELFNSALEFLPDAVSYFAKRVEELKKKLV